MRKFFKDYAEYTKKSSELCTVWYKNNWKGTMVITLLYIVLVTFGISLYYGVKDKKNKTDDNEETEA